MEGKFFISEIGLPISCYPFQIKIVCSDFYLKHHSFGKPLDGNTVGGKEVWLRGSSRYRVNEFFSSVLCLELVKKTQDGPCDLPGT